MADAGAYYAFLPGKDSMHSAFFESIEENPIIAAVKDDSGLEKCCGLEDIRVVFILYGNICTIADIVKRLKKAGKITMVHLDLITGLVTKEISVDFIRENTEADGIISTRPDMIRRAIELNLYTDLRIFVLDSMAYANIEKQLNAVHPDIVEILPGTMPKVIRKVCRKVRKPVVASGLIEDKEDIMNALTAGAIAISSTNQKVWEM